jgi:hypothetical protein
VAGDRGAGLRECNGNSCAKTAGGTGHKRYFIVEAKAIKNIPWRR